MLNKQTKIVVIGGGTGSFVLLSGLKQYPVDLTAIVPVTDDGGSTGRLRDEFGFLPVGDMRQCLAALASENGILRQLLLYRFNKGAGLKGHNLGNLILTSLEDLVGSEPEAIEVAAKIFKLKGKVLPISSQLVKLAASYSTGKTIISEHKIETHKLKVGETIKKLYTVPKAVTNPKATKAIKQADLIILAAGDLYNSIIANLVISGTKKAINQSKAKIVYVINLMTLNSQTHHFTAKKHLSEIEKYLEKEVDHILINNQPIPDIYLKAYKKLDEFPVKDDLKRDIRVIRKHLLADSSYQKPKSDSLKRSLLRHDSDKLASAIIELI
ncbi:MAG: gluconeogenesis factor YvcK family protein [Candidatus Beckwithbacteria bacterium]|nr:YvcK family protein [Patescibacteria group bacterium]